MGHAGSRSIIISSFDPEICLLAAVKQIRYPVFFLTRAGHGDSTSSDTRKHSIASALNFAASAGLEGIVANAAAVLEDLTVVQKTHELNLLLFTYGKDNNDPTLYDKQKEKGVDGIITDRICLIEGKQLPACALPAKKSVVNKNTKNLFVLT